MDRNTLSKIQNYLRLTLGSKQLKVEGRENKLDSADVTINGEFLGVIFEDKEDGDICYHFNMTVLDKNCEFLTTQQAANFLSLKPTTLHQCRWSGRGPKFIRLGTRSIRYRLEDLLNWIDSSN